MFPMIGSPPPSESTPEKARKASEEYLIARLKSIPELYERLISLASKSSPSPQEAEALVRRAIGIYIEGFTPRKKSRLEAIALHYQEKELQPPKAPSSDYIKLNNAYNNIFLILEDILQDIPDYLPNRILNNLIQSTQPKKNIPPAQQVEERVQHVCQSLQGNWEQTSDGGSYYDMLCQQASWRLVPFSYPARTPATLDECKARVNGAIRKYVEMKLRDAPDWAPQKQNKYSLYQDIRDHLNQGFDLGKDERAR